jgi:hypothetical protein
MPITVPSATADYLSFPDGSSPVTLARVPRKTQHAALTGTLLHFDGLAYPRVYFGENRDESWDVEYRVVQNTDGDQWTNLRTLLAAASVLLWRDTAGNSTYCAVLAGDQTPMLPMPQPITDLRFTLARVTYP